MPPNKNEPTLLVPQRDPAPGVSRTGSYFLSGFESIAPQYRKTQSEALEWLVQAHLRAGGIEESTIRAFFGRFSASADQISARGHELADFSHQRWDEMSLFGPNVSMLTEKMRFFNERATAVLERFYPVGTAAPPAIIHVTCTGYAAPSGAQNLVSYRGWGQKTEVLHAYHMGCYASHPAIRMAVGLGGGDVVHTELCTLHFNPALHDAGQLVIQSLFADGFMKYSVRRTDGDAPVSGLEFLGARDEILPDSTGAMAWSTGPMHFIMGLSREVPVLFASALPGFVERLLEGAGQELRAAKSDAIFAIHPGGPRIVELSQKILGLDPAQVRWSRDVLRDHGNMSSATLPHIWQRILMDPAVPDGTLIVSLGAGPGLTLSGMLFRKRA